MATTLPAILLAQTSVPQQVEAKFTMLPKLSTVLAKVAGMLPKGPAVFPDIATKSPTLPALPQIFKGAPTTPTTTAALPLSPYVPGAQRGSIDYGKLLTAPLTPGAGRGTVIYGS